MNTLNNIGPRTLPSSTSEEIGSVSENVLKYFVHCDLFCRLEENDARAHPLIPQLCNTPRSRA